MKKYVCGVCGYVYDPAKGDKDGGVAPGTAFEDLRAIVGSTLPRGLDGR